MQKTKILMFGWEFPPHISGGLGTACYGLTKGLSHYKNVEVIFVIPSAEAIDNTNNPHIIGADTIKVTSYSPGELIDLKLLKVPSRLTPYVSSQEFDAFSENGMDDSEPVKITKEGCIEFSIGYGPSLHQEVKYFAAVAETIAQQEKFDIIHAHDWPTFLAGKVAKEISGKPLITHIHSTEFDRNTGAIHQNIYDWEKLGMDAADHIIAVSNQTRETILTHYQQNEQKIATIYNAIEPEKSIHFEDKEYKPSKEILKVGNKEKNQDKSSSSNHISELEVNKNLQDKIVTFLGRITAQKGPEFFIEAASLLLKSMKNVRFVMAGDGDLQHEMIRLAAQKNMTHRFHFTGFLHRNDVYKLLKMSNVYVMPSVSEPFGISTLEAIQSGVPVIVSKQSGVSEILKNVLKVNYWNAEELADAIHALLTDTTLPQTLTKKAHKEIQNLSWHQTAEQVISLYKHVISNSKNRTQVSV